jgi:hypothetical protein
VEAVQVAIPGVLMLVMASQLDLGRFLDIGKLGIQGCLGMVPREHAWIERNDFLQGRWISTGFV